MSFVLVARRALTAAVSAVLLAGCFPVSVVPASEAPPIPPGEGWSCFESVSKPKTAMERTRHTVRCQREVEQCQAQSDRERRSGNVDAVSTCSARPTAFCAAMFMSSDDPTWGCFGAMPDCDLNAHVIGLPGTKRTECAAYN